MATKKNNPTNVFTKSKSTAPFTPPKQADNAASGTSALNRMGKPNKSNDLGGNLKPQLNISYKPSQREGIAMPVLKNTEKEAELVKYLVDRLMLSDIERQARISRAMDIDVQLSGYIKLDPDDRKRQRDNKRGKAPKPVKHNLPLAQAQLDEAVTYLMGVFAPDTDIFTAQSSANKQEVADGVTAEVNKQGQRVGYYRHFAKFCNNAMRYNFGAMSCWWEKQYGYVFKTAGAGTITKDVGVVWEGNILKSMDVYNFFYDTSVHPVDLPIKGEYFAWAEAITPFRARKMENDNLLFGVDRFLTQDNKTVVRQGSPVFYQSPPTIRDDVSGQGTNKTMNWQVALRDNVSGTATESQTTIELVNFVCWITPKYWGLSDSKELELWMLKLCQGSYISYAIRLDDTHGMLPVAITTPIEDDLNNDQRTYAEQLMPLQHFASFLMNTHQDAVRKSIYGISLYNPQIFPGLDKDTSELVAAVIPMRSSAGDVDIDKAFRHYNAAPDTDQNVDMIEKINALMQKILPTDQLKQVADLERATLYQAAATVQGANRRNLKIARIISDQALTIVKLLMLYNIYANMQQITYIDEATGKETQISPADILDALIEFDVGTGLKGIDRLMQLQIWQYITNAIIQSQQALQEIDVVKLLTYVANLAGDKTDLSQFKRETPAPAIPKPGDPQQQVPPTAPIPQASQA